MDTIFTIACHISIWAVLGIITHVAHSVHYNRWLQNLSKEDQEIINDFFENEPYEDNGAEPCWQENLLRACMFWPAVWFEYILNIGTGKNAFDATLEELKEDNSWKI
jgi:hypothetical protein